jgi:hypothetical protein
MRNQFTAVPAPVPGETFPSWVDRIAAANSMPVTSLLHAAGITQNDTNKGLPTGYGYQLTDQQTENLSYVTGTHPETIKAMLTSSWIGTKAKAVTSKEGNETDNARQFTLRNWFYGNGSHYCPACLKANKNAWLLNWKLPFVFACTEHETLLHSTCPACNQRALQNRHTNGLKPEYATRIPKPGTCKNAPETSQNAASRGPCGHNLAEEQQGMPLPEWLIELQSQTLTKTSSLEWWSDMQALAIYAIIAVPIDTVHEILNKETPEPFKHAWTARQTANQERLEQDRATDNDFKAYKKDTTARTPPHDPHVMAIATAIAFNTLKDETKLETLINAGKKHDSTGQLPQQRLKALGASTKLQATIMRVIQGENHNLIAAGLHSRYAQKGTNLDPETIPPYIWEDLYDEHLSALTKDLPIHKNTLRRFVSIAIRKSATGEHWGDATKHYIDKHLASPRLAPAQMSKIIKTQGDTGLNKILNSISLLAEQLAEDPRTVAYPETRKKANEIYSQPLNENQYRDLHPNSEPTQARQKWGAVKAWVNATSDHRINAPVWGPNGPNENDLESYRRWEKTVTQP